MIDKILIIDDEPEMLQVLQRFFSRKGYDVTVAQSGEEGWQILTETVFDLVISDLAMKNMDGLELLKQVRTIDSNLPFIIMTGVGTIDSAVEAIKFGAYHYVTKPFKTQDLEFLSRRAIENGKLHRKLDAVSAREETNGSFPLIMGNNRLVREMLATIEKISNSMAPVLIQGETGTGKTVFARQIHLSSSRHDKPFVTIDCGALAPQLLESELFGHVKGAFTGAVAAKRGLLEEAQGGTVFLDEIGELTPPTQVKLLRAIQEYEIKSVGGNKTTTIDVRFISATNRNLEKDVESGTFRDDLYYRLAVIPLYLPPLRERREDLLVFIGHFVEKFNARYKKNISSLAPSVLQFFMDSQWKGNIRELENIVERAVLLAEGNTITMENVCGPCAPIAACEDSNDNTKTVTLKQIVEKAEIAAIKNALAISQGNRTQAASILGIGRRTLYDKIDAYQIK